MERQQGGDSYVPYVALSMFWYNKKERAITRLKGVITPGIFGKGKKSIKLETVVSTNCNHGATSFSSPKENGNFQKLRMRLRES
jgi:hypothetical protein